MRPARELRRPTLFLARVSGGGGSLILVSFALKGEGGIKLTGISC